MDIEEEKLKGQAEIWEHMFAFVNSMALKCAVELGIPDIINSHGGPVTIVEESGFPFEKAHGCDAWDLALANPHFNQLFNDGMECSAKIVVNNMLANYKDGFNGIGVLVDVGGGMGSMIAGIVKANPHIKGVNFDLPHVVATAPEHPGITHVGGDMFDDIQEADAIIMKWIMHDWSDEDCVKILRNCYKAISKTKNGKVIIVDCVLQPDGNGLFDEAGLLFDLMMIVNTSGGKERTEVEWNMLLNSAGFTRYNIIRIPAFPSIIEAFPE
ncbi:hypothetical protein C5167_001491 [Papaver somniferum]|uniref:O-methyltransferase domain-containing protein n=1 Tax=Papaver somniferum TaxID=3469 RepID=A0A4Y7KVE5_PAPSO|nr:hypothetical protein C5167_001491 [Papaver somniferum]